MNKRIGAILEDLAVTLSGLNGVFSTPQWGGRAYKLPGPNSNLKKPKLLAFVVLSKNQDSINVAFKLSVQRSTEVVDSYEWIEPHSFRTLAPAGWVSATLTNKRQVKTLKKMLKESRELYPAAEVENKAVENKSTGDEASQQIDRVMNAFAAEGWVPMEDDGFDD